MTDAQLDFIFLAKQEREKMKQEGAEREMQKSQMKQNFGGTPSTPSTGGTPSTPSGNI